MSTQHKLLRVRPCALAAQLAILSFGLPGVALAETTVDDLVKPTSVVEIGVGDVSKASAKFGEYNGLNKSGSYLIGGFDLRGGDAYDSEGALRYRITARDLGLDTRSLNGDVGQQGRFRLTFGYDALVKNRSDSYQTMYLGGGSNALSLPPNWATNQHNCVVNATASGGPNATTGGTMGCGNYYINQATNNATTATPTGNALALTPAELADLKPFALATKRERYDLGLNYVLSPNWSFSTSARHELKNGAQAIGLPFVTTNAQVTIPNPINYVTNQFNFNLSFKNAKGYADLGYYLSNFRDLYDSVLVQDPYFSASTPAVAATNGITTFPYPAAARLSSMPDNRFRQFTLTAGYDVASWAKLTAHASQGRGTQNVAFLPPGTGAWETAPAGALPQTSLNGRVNYSSALLKLTLRPVRDLQVVAGFKTDERNNQTLSNLYNFRDTDQQTTFVTGAPNNSIVQPSGTAAANALGGMSANSSLYNLPYSKKVRTANADADYRLTRGQNLRLALESQKVTRWCDNIPAAGAAKVDNCFNSLAAKDNSSKLEYRNSLFETVSGRISALHASRKADPYHTDVAEYAQDILTRFNMTDRKRNQWRANLAWMPNEFFDLNLSGSYTKDDFTLGRNPNSLPPATLPAGSSGAVLLAGLERSKNSSVTLDLGVHPAEGLNFSAFYTQENIDQVTRGNAGTSYAAASLTATPSDWAATMRDRVHTLGLGFKADELMGGRLQVTGDFVRVRSSTPYGLSASTQYAFSTSTTAPTATMTAAAYASGLDFPATYNDTDTLKLGARFTLNKTSAFRVALVHQRMASADPILYTGLQPGTATALVSGSATAKVNGTPVPANSVYAISALMPTLEQAPNYSVTAIGIAYIFSFR